ncbi:MAG TPA: FAD-binding oxidoreductase [Candidatus Avacidaminococcus intestinavium]|uniref:FAD-binding oxidoreductase n=1 Tax=Candidatus Avacidaminococcus intestinavium TaxID=2840684 RepID=A0A9D1MRK2_9FIRM|nr:FAD-binding oxidoreductase [Candidatus Avacidaminococcus intestinavium]
MSNYQAVNEEVLMALRTAVGEEHVFCDAEKLNQYKTDEETDVRFHHLPEVVVAPANAKEVAAVVKIANQFLVPITPRSAGTSVSCGAIAVCGGIVLLLERMNKIIELNEDAMYMVVEAGVRTAEIQELANSKGLLYAGDPCSSDSCLIGGNIATNAGGNKAVRYGTTRNQVYEIEVVTPTGEITTLGARLNKKTTGYCLEQLVIGSEGTLGIITKATLKLLPLAPYKLDILAIFTDLDQAIGIVPVLVKAGLNPTSVEFMANEFVRSASDYCQLRLPHYEDGHYVIITVETFNEDELEVKMEQLDELCNANGATDVLEADERVWKIRRNCLESTRVLSLINSSDDLVVPVEKIAYTIEHLTKVAQGYPFKMFTLAHAGDGNLHFTMLKGDLSDAQWESELERFHAEAYPFIYSMGGRISGEHGIGAKKIGPMEKYTDPVEMQMMKTIKQALDPNNILNPGKIFNL